MMLGDLVALRMCVCVRINRRLRVRMIEQQSRFSPETRHQVLR